MPTAVIDGIPTRYEVAGDGPPLLMFSPGGFDSSLEGWREVGVYRRLRLLDRLTERYTCITFDRRESGWSGGRLERISWADYAAQGVGLLDHLGIGRAHLMGGCVGCSTAAVLAVARPDRVLSMVLYSPAGGVKYRMKQHARFLRHLAHAEEHGPAGVVELARSTDAGFTADPRVGPWARVIRRDDEFAERYARTDAGRYQVTVGGMARLLFDRDTVPGPEPEDLLTLDVPALVVPGQDDSHAPSAARYLQECLPLAEYWGVPVTEQTERSAPARVLEFLDGVRE
ncbi:alpha/beta fold hydrolase [Streptomyces sp. NPDC059396]|uniref:alpha/beta fold hydrolase n=1 Tax=Streptomyces sp. NPDC059396 TaxID=3346819 RepID=UPI0036A923F6